MAVKRTFALAVRSAASPQAQREALRLADGTARLLLAQNSHGGRSSLESGWEGENERRLKLDGCSWDFFRLYGIGHVLATGSMLNRSLMCSCGLIGPSAHVLMGAICCWVLGAGCWSRYTTLYSRSRNGYSAMLGVPNRSASSMPAPGDGVCPSILSSASRRTTQLTRRRLGKAYAGGHASSASSASTAEVCCSSAAATAPHGAASSSIEWRTPRGLPG